MDADWCNQNKWSRKPQVDRKTSDPLKGSASAWKVACSQPRLVFIFQLSSFCSSLHHTLQPTSMYSAALIATLLSVASYASAQGLTGELTRFLAPSTRLTAALVPSQHAAIAHSMPTGSDLVVWRNCALLPFHHSWWPVDWYALLATHTHVAVTD